MAVAMIYPEAEKTGRGKKSSVSEDFVKSTYLSQARTVLEFSPAIVGRHWREIAGLDLKTKGRQRGAIVIGSDSSPTARGVPILLFCYSLTERHT